MEKTIIIDGQNVLDASIQLTGSIENMFDVANMNNVGVTDVLASGSQISVEAERNDVLSYYKSNEVKPASRITDDSEIQLTEGIGTWIIGVNFRIS